MKRKIAEARVRGVREIGSLGKDSNATSIRRMVKVERKREGRKGGAGDDRSSVTEKIRKQIT